MTQIALARALELSASYLNQLEQNQRPLTVPVLQSSGMTAMVGRRSSCAGGSDGLKATGPALSTGRTRQVRTGSGQCLR